MAFLIFSKKIRLKKPLRNFWEFLKRLTSIFGSKFEANPKHRLKSRKNEDNEIQYTAKKPSEKKTSEDESLNITLKGIDVADLESQYIKKVPETNQTVMKGIDVSELENSILKKEKVPSQVFNIDELEQSMKAQITQPQPIDIAEIEAQMLNATKK